MMARPSATSAGGEDASDASGIDADDGEIQEGVVPDAHRGMRLDQSLALLFGDYSRSRLQSWLASGRIVVDGARGDPARKVRGGEVVLLAAAPDPSATSFVAEPMPLPIVFEDDAIIVIDKPAGLVVHPAAGNWSGTLLNGLLAHAPKLASVPRAGIVHRLDKDTTGLMVAAKSIEAQTNLIRQLQARTVRREYLALVHGLVHGDGEIDAPIGRHPRERTLMAVVTNGKPALTRYIVIEQFAASTLLRCRLETGRTHQIRVHLTSIGHPLVGDPVYRGKPGQRGPVEFTRQALHAERLGLAHPATDKPMSWTARVPDDLGALLESLRE
jgi:23S rRNA pseudouridine1911/1915/1917 synthase